MMLHPFYGISAYPLILFHSLPVLPTVLVTYNFSHNLDKVTSKYVHATKNNILPLLLKNKTKLILSVIIIIETTFKKNSFPSSHLRFSLYATISITTSQIVTIIIEMSTFTLIYLTINNIIIIAITEQKKTGKITFHMQSSQVRSDSVK